MVTITCDVCKRVKQRDQEWILGFDPDADVTYAVRHSPTFLTVWDSARIFEAGAIHLCSEECEQEYLCKAQVA
jgi:hypothetical protein